MGVSFGGDNQLNMSNRVPHSLALADVRNGTIILTVLARHN